MLVIFDGPQYLVSALAVVADNNFIDYVLIWQTRVLSCAVTMLHYNSNKHARAM